MRSVKIKICGMRDLSNIQDVAALRPDYLGFIFYPKSPRYVGNDFHLPSLNGIRKVGVFVNASQSEVLSTAKKFQLDYVQLHGNETVEECMALQEVGLKVVKAFAVDDGFDFRTTVAYEPGCEFFLFDTKGKYFGGNAVPFDWKNLARYNQAKPFFLSGGLNENNIAGVRELKDTNLYAVDLNSGVEIQPAVKDTHKIENIKRNINSWI